MPVKKFIILLFFLMASSVTLSLGNDIKLLDSSALAGEKLYLGMKDAVIDRQNVRKLCLGGQDLRDFPEDATNFENLQEINISQNFIDFLPESFCRLEKLTELKMSTNSLIRLPDCFRNFKFLRHLEIATNPTLKWDEILPVLCNIKSLEYLDISDNEINSIPECFLMLQNLKELNVSGNKIPKETIEHIKNVMSKTIIISD